MATDKLILKDYLRHGEAVGLGMLCEIYYSNPKETKLLKSVAELLNLYDLPTKIINRKTYKDLSKLQNEIFSCVFLDKKKIGKFPRFIFIKNKLKPSIKEIQNFNLLNITIKKFLI